MKIYTCIIIALTFMSLDAKSQDYDGVKEEDVYVKLRYKGCYQGSDCPNYEITILGDGTVIYEGKRDVAKIGVYQKKIEKQKIADLLTEILSIRYFERTDESEDCGYASV